MLHPISDCTLVLSSFLTWGVVFLSFLFHFIMDSKLRALKVVDLRNILSTASVQVPAKATKTDLIARIQASKPALDAYASLYPADDLLAPPEEVDWNADQPPKSTPSNPTPAPAPTPTPSPVTTTIVPAVQPPLVDTSLPATTTIDPELEKRRQRAARFGIPLVKTPIKTAKPKPVNSKPTSAAIDPKKLDERAARFGLKPEQTPPNAKKRPSPQVQEIDSEELERRKKRAARFGIPQ